MNNMVVDKEILVRNGTLEVYNDQAQLNLVIFPTTVHGDEQVNEFQQRQQPHIVNQHRRSGDSDNALIVNDLTRFNTSFVLREGKHINHCSFLIYIYLLYSQITDANHDQYERQKLLQSF